VFWARDVKDAIIWVMCYVLALAGRLLFGMLRHGPVLEVRQSITSKKSGELRPRRRQIFSYFLGNKLLLPF
jgi:hypothetical protein